MENSSEVIWRNRAELEDHPVLFVNAAADELGNRLAPLVRELKFSCQDFAQCRSLRDMGRDAVFELLPQQDSETSSMDTVVLSLPREKDRLRMLAHWLADCSRSRLPALSRLWVVGENRGGIKSASRHLESFFSQVVKLDSARHCSLLEARLPLTDKPFAVADWFQEWDLPYAGADIEMLSLPGVFAHGRLDPGSRLLLESLSALPVEGRVLDFATGSGVLGIALATSRPGCHLTLLDVSAPALASAKASLERNDVEADVLASDGTSELHGTFDWIISNPPFHRGIQQTLDVSRTFFQSAGTFLTKNGKIVIVCNRHLPYEQWMREHFRQVSRLAMNNEFTVLQASVPA